MQRALARFQCGTLGAAPEALYPGMNVSAKIIVEEVGSVLALPVEAVERGNTVLVAKEGCLDENGVIKDLSAAEFRPWAATTTSTSRSWTAWRRAKWCWR